MILAALVAYADRMGLGDLDFETRGVDYDLRIDEEGCFVSLVPMGTSFRRAQFSRLPKAPPSKNNPGYPSFLVDNAQYVLGTERKNAKKSTPRSASNRIPISSRTRRTKVATRLSLHSLGSLGGAISARPRTMS